MSNTVLYLILFIYIFITLHIIINSFFLLIIIIKRKDVRIISDSKKINIIFIIKLVLLLANIIICFYLFCSFLGGVIEMAKSIFEVFLTTYLLIVIPTTFVFSLIGFITGILIYGVILKSDISVFNKIMLISLNMLPMFDIITILIMKDRKNNK